MRIMVIGVKTSPKPSPGVGPVPVGSSERKAKHFSSVMLRQPAEESKSHEPGRKIML